MAAGAWGPPSAVYYQRAAMTVAELRAKIRALMASGDLPSEAPSIERCGGDESARFALQDPAKEPCTICGEPRGVGPHR